MTTPGPELYALPVGHPARPAAARALWVSVAVASLFTVFAYASTQVHAVRAGSPWQNDPYDALVSLTEFLVPVLSALVVTRMWLCRRFEPLPLFRVRQVLRAAQVATGLVAGTVAVDWVAAATGADQPLWDRGTPWLIATLVPLSGAVLAAFGLQRSAIHRLPRGARPPAGDWLDDAAALAERLRTPRVAAWLRATRVLDHIRRHVLVVAAAISILASAAVTTALVVGEGGGLPPQLYLTMAVIYAAGLFAFCLIANRTLHLATARTVANPNPSAQGQRLSRAAYVAVVAAALSAYVAFALRDTIGSALFGAPVTTVGQLVLVSLAGALLAGALSFAAVLAVGELTRRSW